jgi:hypothetical protein
VTRFHDPATDRAHPRQELLSCRAGEVPAARTGAGHADPGGIPAWHLDAPSGPAGGHADRRGGERADGFPANTRSGSGSTAVSSSAAQDEWAYLFLDGVALKVRRPAGRQHVQMLVAYGVRQDGTRRLLAFLRTRGESQADWEALLGDLYRRGLKWDKLLLIVTEGCPGMGAAIQTVYPRVAHQRCWVHKMRNILDKLRKRDHDAVKADAHTRVCVSGHVCLPGAVSPGA